MENLRNTVGQSLKEIKEFAIIPLDDGNVLTGIKIEMDLMREILEYNFGKLLHDEIEKVLNMAYAGLHFRIEDHKTLYIPKYTKEEIMNKLSLRKTNGTSRKRTGAMASNKGD